MARAATPASGRGSKTRSATRNNMPSGRIPQAARAAGQGAVYANDGVSAFGNISAADVKRLRGQYGNQSTSK